jgi:hypothetical protein
VIHGGAVAAVVVALLAAAEPARGALDVPGVPAGPLRVALLSTTPDDPLAGRIDAELRTIGIDVSRSVVTPGTGIEEQVRAEIAGGARAVIVADGHRTDVWISEPGSDRVGLRQELEVDEASGRQAVLALRTVEFLRISLGLVAEPVVAPVASAPPPVVRPAPPTPAPGRWMTAGALGGVLAASGSGGTIAIAGIGLGAQLDGMVGAELGLYAPLTEATLTSADNQARTSVWMAGGGILLAPQSDRRISVEVGAGALAAVFRSSGAFTAAHPPPVFTVTQVRGAVYGRGAARLRLAPHLALRLDVFGGAVINPPHIVFDTQDLGAWGPAFAAGLGGAELVF